MLIIFTGEIYLGCKVTNWLFFPRIFRDLREYKWMIIHGFSKKSNSENYFREQVRYLNTKKIVGGCIVRLKVR